jgi:Spy/CpxP family protein refolding chaperone
VIPTENTFWRAQSWTSTASLFKNSQAAIDAGTYGGYLANNMKNRYSFRLLAIGTTFIIALTASAQQAAAGPGATGKNEHGQRAAQDGVPKVEQMLKVLTEKLALTSDQQRKIKPILQELHDATQKIVQDESLSREERLAKVGPRRYKADKQIREILTDDQKKKLDQYQQGPHPEMHGNLNGTTPPPP